MTAEAIEFTWIAKRSIFAVNASMRSVEDEVFDVESGKMAGDGTDESMVTRLVTVFVVEEFKVGSSGGGGSEPLADTGVVDASKYDIEVILFLLCFVCLPIVNKMAGV